MRIERALDRIWNLVNFSKVPLDIAIWNVQGEPVPAHRALKEKYEPFEFVVEAAANPECAVYDVTSQEQGDELFLPMSWSAPPHPFPLATLGDRWNKASTRNLV